MIKKFFILFFCLVLAGVQAQVGINTTTPNPNAVLHVNSHFGGSQYGGFMPPKVTLDERNSIPVTAADDGLMLYVSYPNGDRCLQLFNGASLTWGNINCFQVPVSTPGTIFFESMGTVASDTPVNTHHTNLGFDNSSTCNFSSNSATQSDIRITLPSTTHIPSASGSGNLFLNTGTRDFLIQNIDLTSFVGPFTIKMLIHKNSTASNGSELLIEYHNGSSWVNISTSSLPTVSGSGIWHEAILSTTIPNTINSIRISRGSSGPTFRVDDIEILIP